MGPDAICSERVARSPSHHVPPGAQEGGYRANLGKVTCKPREGGAGVPIPNPVSVPFFLLTLLLMPPTVTVGSFSHFPAAAPHSLSFHLALPLNPGRGLLGNNLLDFPVVSPHLTPFILFFMLVYSLVLDLLCTHCFFFILLRYRLSWVQKSWGCYKSGKPVSCVHLNDAGCEGSDRRT